MWDRAILVIVSVLLSLSSFIIISKWYPQLSLTSIDFNHQIQVAIVTAPSKDVAQQLVKKLLAEKAVACVNIVSGVESHYWWEGKINIDSEYLLIIKTARFRIEEMMDIIIKNHPYVNPEILFFNANGSDRYLRWVHSSVIPDKTQDEL